MLCASCHLNTIDPRRAPYGGYMCNNVHMQCGVCEARTSGSCAICKACTYFVRMNVSEAGNTDAAKRTTITTCNNKMATEFGKHNETDGNVEKTNAKEDVKLQSRNKQQVKQGKSNQTNQINQQTKAILQIVERHGDGLSNTDIEVVAKTLPNHKLTPEQPYEGQFLNEQKKVEIEKSAIEKADKTEPCSQDRKAKQSQIPRLLSRLGNYRNQFTNVQQDPLMSHVEVLETIQETISVKEIPSKEEGIPQQQQPQQQQQQQQPQQQQSTVAVKSVTDVDPVRKEEPTEVQVAFALPGPVAQQMPLPVTMSAQEVVTRPSVVSVIKPSPIPVTEPAPLPVIKPMSLPIIRPLSLPLITSVSLPVTNPMPIPLSVPMPVVSGRLEQTQLQTSQIEVKETESQLPPGKQSPKLLSDSSEHSLLAAQLLDNYPSYQYLSDEDSEREYYSGDTDSDFRNFKQLCSHDDSTNREYNISYPSPEYMVDTNSPLQNFDKLDTDIQNIAANLPAIWKAKRSIFLERIPEDTESEIEISDDSYATIKRLEDLLSTSDTTMDEIEISYLMVALQNLYLSKKFANWQQVESEIFRNGFSTSGCLKTSNQTESRKIIKPKLQLTTKSYTNIRTYNSNESTNLETPSGITLSSDVTLDSNKVVEFKDSCDSEANTKQIEERKQPEHTEEFKHVEEPMLVEEPEYPEQSVEPKQTEELEQPDESEESEESEDSQEPEEPEYPEQPEEREDLEERENLERPEELEEREELIELVEQIELLEPEEPEEPEDLLEQVQLIEREKLEQQEHTEQPIQPGQPKQLQINRQAHAKAKKCKSLESGVNLKSDSNQTGHSSPNTKPITAASSTNIDLGEFRILEANRNVEAYRSIGITRRLNTLTNLDFSKRLDVKSSSDSPNIDESITNVNTDFEDAADEMDLDNLSVNTLMELDDYVNTISMAIGDKIVVDDKDHESLIDCEVNPNENNLNQQISQNIEENTAKDRIGNEQHYKNINRKDEMKGDRENAKKTTHEGRYIKVKIPFDQKFDNLAEFPPLSSNTDFAYCSLIAAEDKSQEEGNTSLLDFNGPSFKTEFGNLMDLDGFSHSSLQSFHSLQSQCVHDPLKANHIEAPITANNYPRSPITPISSSRTLTTKPSNYDSTNDIDHKEVSTHILYKKYSYQASSDIPTPSCSLSQASGTPISLCSSFNTLPSIPSLSLATSATLLPSTERDDPCDLASIMGQDAFKKPPISSRTYTLTNEEHNKSNFDPFKDNPYIPKINIVQPIPTAKHVMKWPMSVLSNTNELITEQTPPLEANDMKFLNDNFDLIAPLFINTFYAVHCPILAAADNNTEEILMQFALMKCPESKIIELLRSEHKLIDMEALPLSALHISRSPLICPQMGCKRMTFVSDFCKHLVIQHGDFPIVYVTPHQCQNFTIDYRLPPIGETRCHLGCLVKEVVSGLGTSKYHDCLPLMVMSARLSSTDICNLPPQSTNLTMRQCNEEFLLIWVTGLVPNSIPIRITLAVFQPFTTKPGSHIVRSGKVYSIRNPQDALSILYNTNAILLSYADLYNLSNHGKQMIHAQLFIN